MNIQISMKTVQMGAGKTAQLVNCLPEEKDLGLEPWNPCKTWTKEHLPVTDVLEQRRDGGRESLEH